MKRSTLHTVLLAAGAVALLAYMVVMLCITGRKSDMRVCEGVEITVNDTARLHFVTPREVAHDLMPLIGNAKGKLLSSINLDSIERRLRGIDKVETAYVTVGTDGVIHIVVNPMEPVARVFGSQGSYYINKDGKRISATARYFVDVPVIQGDFVDSVFSAGDLLPLVDYIHNDSLWSQFVTMIKVDSPDDIILVPGIRGQVINFGSCGDFKSKFGRLYRMYTEVLPERGWDFYDTLSVKWRGQVVATRRQKQLPKPDYADEPDEEEVDVATMLAAEGVAPGQSIPGRKANNEKPIPAAQIAKGDTIKKK